MWIIVSGSDIGSNVAKLPGNPSTWEA